MGSIFEHLGSKSVDFGVLGSPGGRLGAMLDPMAGQRGASSQKGTKRLTLGRPFWRHFLAFFWILVFFWRPDFQSVFWTAFKLDFGGFWGDLLGPFLDFLGHFVDASAEVENVVWTHYLL